MLNGRRLLLLLRGEDRYAQSIVLNALREHGGNVTATARTLGVSSDSLYAIAAAVPEFGSRFRAAAQGMDGARRAAVRARRVRAGLPVSGDTASGADTPEKK